MKLEVERPETVRAPAVLASPLPKRLLKEEPLTRRLVVEAVRKEEYIVEEEYPNLFRPVQELVSASKVEEAVESERQVLLMAKQPAERLKPTLEVEVA